jgi:D-3-phosphoglycerate dehydrogenase
MNKKKIAIIEPIGLSVENIQQLKETFKGHEIEIFDSRNYSDDELITSLKDTNILALTNRPLNYNVIKNLPCLELIAVAFAGMDHIDSQAVKEKNIIIKNASGYANSAVSELVIGFMIALSRNIVQNNNQMNQNISTNTGSELKGKTLGIVGFGNIGKEVEKLACAFGMHVITYGSNNTLDDLKNLFSKSDFISLHIPLTEQTRGLINKDYLSLMKKSAFLINCARGPIVNQLDLINALEQNQLKAAAIDVFDTEPPLASNHPLLNRADIIATPHIGFNTKEALKEKARIAIHHIKTYLDSLK